MWGLQVDCIHWVSAPQLALLETAMQKMDRVHAWLLNTGGGSAVNVFQVILLNLATVATPNNLQFSGLELA